MYDPHQADGQENCALSPSPSLVPDAEDYAEVSKVNDFRSSNLARRRTSVSAQPVDQNRFLHWQAPVIPKAPEHTLRIKDCIARSDKLQVLFGHLHPIAIDRVVDAFFYRAVQVGEIVIQQGADGDFFYIVDNGVFDIYVQRLADTLPERVMQAQEGSCFGELALMYNVPRAATVQCVIPGGLWCLDRESFQMMLVTSENSKSKVYESFLQNVDILRDLTVYERATVSDLLEPELFDSGETIVQQGEPGDTFYFLYEGECKAYMYGQQGEVEVKHYTFPGEYFGEIALLHAEPRRASVRASGDGCVVLRLKREDVDLSIGSIQERLATNAAYYRHYDSFISAALVDPVLFQQ